jgi:hypothetical protein
MCFGVARSRAPQTPAESIGQRLDKLYNESTGAAVSSKEPQLMLNELKAIQEEITEQRFFLLSVPLSRKRVLQLHDLSELERKSLALRKISNANQHCGS